MARTISRSQKMNNKIVMRATEEDVANIRLHSQKAGLDVSQFLRQILIRERILTPLG